MIKEYVNESGYRIKASEKAYNLLYKKNGFRPVSDAGTTDTPAAESGKNVDAENLPEKAGRKAAAKKSGKASGNQNAAGQPEDGKKSPSVEKVDCDSRDAAEQPEES